MTTIAVTKITVSSTDVRLRASVSVVDPAVEVSRAIPVTEIAYIYLQVLASLDNTGLFRYITDSAVVSDGKAFSLTKGFQDSVATSDVSTRSSSKALADVLEMLDSAVATLIFLRDFTDTQDVEDFFALEFVKTVSEVSSLSDALSFAFDKLIEDGFAMNDSSEATDGITFSFALGVENVVTSSDSSFRSFAKTRTESVSIGDTGILLQQDYIDLTYFAEDYVGVGYVF
jgi:hypothetical protein